jgi:hypothetical protein
VVQCGSKERAREEDRLALQKNAVSQGSSSSSIRQVVASSRVGRGET